MSTARGEPCVDRTRCDRLALHAPGRIQPHGALLVLRPASEGPLLHPLRDGAPVSRRAVLAVEGPP